VGIGLCRKVGKVVTESRQELADGWRRTLEKTATELRAGLV